MLKSRSCCCACKKIVIHNFFRSSFIHFNNPMTMLLLLHHGGKNEQIYEWNNWKSLEKYFVYLVQNLHQFWCNTRSQSWNLIFPDFTDTKGKTSPLRIPINCVILLETFYEPSVHNEQTNSYNSCQWLGVSGREAGIHAHRSFNVPFVNGLGGQRVPRNF